jgi:hypothetical protein
MYLKRFSIFIGVFVLIWGAALGASEAEAEPQAAGGNTPPRFHNLRYEEDWSAYRPSDPEGLDSVKFVRLSEDGRSSLTVGGQLRLRGEGWSDFNFGGPGSRTDQYGLFRLRLHADFHVGPIFRVFLEGKSALASRRELPGGIRTADMDAADFQNAFVDLAPVPGVIFRLGRQELQFGRQRLVSPLDWSNTRPRSFDGMRGIFTSGAWRMDGFWSRHVMVRKYTLNTSRNSPQDLYGLYAAGRLPGTVYGLDLYWLGYERRLTGPGGLPTRELRNSLGSRLGGTIPGTRFDFDLEGTLQVGDFELDTAEVPPGNIPELPSIRAFMVAAETGYSFTTASSRVYTGFDYASGNRTDRPDRVGTFHQLFPLGHAYLGYIDVVGRQNIIAWSQGTSFRPLRPLLVTADMHNFWRARLDDHLYDAGGNVVRNSGGGGMLLPAQSRRVGLELDFTATYQVNRHLLFTGGYSHFSPGAFIRETGPDEGIDFGYLAVQYTF